MGKTTAEIRSAVEALARSFEPKTSGTQTGLRATIHCDGAARGNPGPAGVGWVIGSGGDTLLEGGRYIGKATNNVAEYEAVLDALEKALELGVRDIELKLDSELVVRQINGTYRVKDEKLLDRYRRVRPLIDRFGSFAAVHIPRKENGRADELANQAIDEVLGKRKNPGSKKS
jgi:ribonuclease HI